MHVLEKTRHAYVYNITKPILQNGGIISLY